MKVLLVSLVGGALVGAFARALARPHVPAVMPAEPRLNEVRPAQAQTQALPRTNAPTTTVRSGSAGGLLLRAIKENKHEPIAWMQLHVGNLVVQVARDAIAARIGGEPIRLPVSYADTVEACKLLGCIAPTKEIVDAAYEQSSKDGRLVFRGMVRTGADQQMMTSVDFSQRFSAGIDRQLKALPHESVIAGPWKYWILHPRIVENGAVNYGGFDVSGSPIQTVGGRHDATHYDYSQLLQPIRRDARLDGRPIDLLDHYLSLGLPKSYVEAFR